MPDLVPCAVPLCPAFARPESLFCNGHQHAMKLPYVSKGWACRKCKRVLKAGDYVTIDSSVGNWEHSECPKPERAAARRGKGATPLFDSPRGAKHI